MISLPADLKHAVRQRDLPCHQAKALGQLTAKKLNRDESDVLEIRAKAVERVLSNALSVRDTRKLVAEILSQHEEEKPKSKGKTKEQYQEVKQSLSKLAVKQLKNTQLKSLKKTIEKKLEEIDSLLENSERIRS